MLKLCYWLNGKTNHTIIVIHVRGFLGGGHNHVGDGKLEIEMEMGTKTHQSLVQCFLHELMSNVLCHYYLVFDVAVII